MMKHHKLIGAFILCLCTTAHASEQENPRDADQTDTLMWIDTKGFNLPRCIHQSVTSVNDWTHSRRFIKSTLKDELEGARDTVFLFSDQPSWEQRRTIRNAQDGNFAIGRKRGNLRIGERKFLSVRHRERLTGAALYTILRDRDFAAYGLVATEDVIPQEFFQLALFRFHNFFHTDTPASSWNGTITAQVPLGDHQNTGVLQLLGFEEDRIHGVLGCRQLALAPDKFYGINLRQYQQQQEEREREEEET